MKKVLFLSFWVLLVGFAACKSKSGDSGGSAAASHNAKEFTKTDSGMRYLVHTKNEGKKAALGHFLTLNMQFSGINPDTLLFSSFGKENPLSFKFQKTLFKGLLNEGLEQMSSGDSATFYLLADSLYGEKLPPFVKSGDEIKYIIKLYKVQTQEEYQKEQSELRNARLKADKEAIDAYISESGEKFEQLQSGTYYKIINKGKGAAPSGRASIKAKYKLSLIDGTLIEDHSNEVKDLELMRNPRGLRDGVVNISKGGKIKLLVPSTLAYGNRVRGKIPANSNLIYELELLDFSEPKKQ